MKVKGDLDLIKTLILKIHNELDDSPTSIIPILNKSLRLANLVEDEDMIRVFEIHLQGIPKGNRGLLDKKVARYVNQTPPSEKAFQIILSDRNLSHHQDRLSSHSAEQLEELLEEFKSLTETDEIHQFKNEINLVLSNIRNRIRSFILSIEKSIIDKSEVKIENIMEVKSKRILILTANPKDTSRLRLDQEVREIDNGLQRSQKRDEFILKQVWAARPSDVRRTLLDFLPNVIHFCGHGASDEGIAFEDDSGKAKLVDAETLATFFELFSEHVECVVLNACFSEVQAKAIGQHIKYVIGMKQEIGDTAAIEYAVGFYDALGAGKSIEFAHKLGCNAIQWTGLSEHLTPTLLVKNEIIESKNPYAKYVDNLTDFFDEVDVDNPVAVELAANEEGKAVLFYNRPFKIHLKRLEYYLTENRIVFLSERNSLRDAGIPISKDLQRCIKNAEKILLVRIDVRNGNVLNQMEVPFKVFD